MASADMQTFREQTTGLIQKTSVKLATPITNSFLRSLPDSKPGLTIVAHMEYSQHANMDEVKGKASNFIDFCRGEEAETHSYVWAVEEGNPRSILVFEQFKSQEFCFDTHMKTDGFIDTTKTHAEGLVTNPTFTKTEFGFDKQWSFQGS
jgi:quinol monooxygenase YgiN